LVQRDQGPERFAVHRVEFRFLGATFHACASEVCAV
jgi:hypothetical protein